MSRLLITPDRSTARCATACWWCVHAAHIYKSRHLPHFAWEGVQISQTERFYCRKPKDFIVANRKILLSIPPHPLLFKCSETFLKDPIVRDELVCILCNCHQSVVWGARRERALEAHPDDHEPDAQPALLHGRPGVPRHDSV
jgi:hypothetical protein